MQTAKDVGYDVTLRYVALDDPEKNIRRVQGKGRVGHTARIVAIQNETAASDAGLAIGDIVNAVNGIPIEQLVRDLIPKCLTRPDPAADAYVLNVALSGRRG